MPSLPHVSIERTRSNVIRALFAAFWLLGTANCFVIPLATGSADSSRAHNTASLSGRSPCTGGRHEVSRATTSLMSTRMPTGRGSGGRGGGGGGGRGRGRGRAPPDAFTLTGEERLQKFLSHAGLDSRRQCEQMILDGRVRVNGKMAKELGIKVDPRRDQVHVDGERVFMRPASEIQWVALNKPKGVICTVSDELGRPTAVDVIPRGKDMRLVPVGRLDRDSCGLILLTNENSWINPLTHPSYGHEKTYRVSITSGYPNAEEWNTLTQGMLLEGDPNPTRPCIVEVVDYDRRSMVTTVDIIIREGKNRQIRRMFEGIGHDVKSITRISHGPIRLKGLRPGEWRALEQWEIEKLKNLTTKTLKSPVRVPRASSRNDGRTPGAWDSKNPSRTSQSRHQETQRDELDEEEDEWNRVGVWDKSGARKAKSPKGGSGTPIPVVVEDEEHEWQTASWARNDDRQTSGGGGSGNKGNRTKGGRKARMTEADRILEKLAQGDTIKAPAWEGGGKVEREKKTDARSKGGWTR